MSDAEFNAAFERFALEADQILNAFQDVCAGKNHMSVALAGALLADEAILQLQDPAGARMAINALVADIHQHTLKRVGN